MKKLPYDLITSTLVWLSFANYFW